MLAPIRLALGGRSTVCDEPVRRKKEPRPCWVVSDIAPALLQARFRKPNPCRGARLWEASVSPPLADRTDERAYVNRIAIRPDDEAGSPLSPPRHVHTPTLVCHVPRYQHINRETT